MVGLALNNRFADPPLVFLDPLLPDWNPRLAQMSIGQPEQFDRAV